MDVKISIWVVQNIYMVSIISIDFYLKFIGWIIDLTKIIISFNNKMEYFKK